MKRNLPKYLEDIRLSIGNIEKYTIKLNSEADLQQNHLLFDALCRRFSIIGEALSQADKLNPNLSVTNKYKIIGLRHLIIHDYDMVSAKEFWSIIQDHLPILKNEIEILLKEFE